jgi:hypothetical protein
MQPAEIARMSMMVRALVFVFAALALAPAARAQQAPGAAAGAERARPFVPASFSPPTRVETKTFTLVPLGPALAQIDFAAYMSSIEHLQKTFTRSTAWPHPGITDADAMRDMEGEQTRFLKRQSFAYAVLTPDGRRERGCVYVSPSPVEGHDAVVRLWVTKAEHDAGFDAELYVWVTGWIRKDWPFRRVAYPGRSINWQAWDAAAAAKTARTQRGE